MAFFYLSAYLQYSLFMGDMIDSGETKIDGHTHDCGAAFLEIES